MIPSANFARRYRNQDRTRMQRTVWILAFVLATALIAGTSMAQTTARVSVSSAGVQANAGATLDDITDDGTFVVFSSTANNLVAGDSNSTSDVFVHSRATGVTTRVSVSTSGVQGNGPSFSGAISADGMRVAFQSGATNFVSPDTNGGGDDIFLHDRQTGVTSLVNASASGIQGNNFSTSPAISADGRFVAFVSRATNLVVGDTNSADDIFVRDLLLGTISRVSVDDSGTQASASSSEPSISSDGRFVAFASSASNLVTGDTNSTSDVFVHDRLLASTVRVSLADTGIQIGQASSRPRIAGNGLSVLFLSTSPNVVPGDTNGQGDGFLRDVLNSTTTRITVGMGGVQLGTGGTASAISETGRFITFWTTASNAVVGDTNGQLDTFLYDRQDQSVSRVSVATGGFQASGGPTTWAIPSSNGAFVAMESLATNLVSFDTNGSVDVFWSDRSLPYALYCFGDGTATGCPCGNSSPVGAQAGCLNSSNVGGRLTLAGTPSIANDTVVLAGGDMKNGPCLYFQGTSTFNSGLGAVLGDGLRCTAGSVIRIGIRVNVAGASRYPGVGDPRVSVNGACMPGDVRSYQIWYRDAQTYCAPETYNLTNGLAFAWQL